MSVPLVDLVDSFGDRSVLVVGDALLDAYAEGPATKLCPEAPAPVVTLEREVELPGGAANCAVNVRSLGANVELLTVVGSDREGDCLLEELARSGVGVTRVVRDGRRRTITKRRIVSGGQLLVRLDRGTTEPIGRRAERDLAKHLAETFSGVDAVIVSDYAFGVVTARLLDALAGMQARSPRILVADGKELGRYRRVGPTAVKPNDKEAVALVGGRRLPTLDARAVWVATNANVILDRCGARIAAVTLDADGAVVVERDRPAYRTYARAARDTRAVGAGDTFAAALALALASGADTPAAAEVASAAASVVVGKERTADCSAAELRERLAGRRKWIDRAALAAVAAEHRRLGRRIVLTNGCFDILHRGHVTYLNQAKALGDVLVVAVNTDAGVKRLKGPTRPINPLDDRAEVLAALSCVDHVVAFEEDTPDVVIEAVRPHLFVKGGDYTRARLPEAALVEALGGAVRILPYVEQCSTTGVIEQIRASRAG